VVRIRILVLEGLGFFIDRSIGYTGRYDTQNYSMLQYGS
jgi:hypothetical protein